MSKFLSLNLADLGKGLLVAVLAVLVSGAYAVIAAEPGSYGTSEQWGVVLHSGVVSGLAYLIKNLFEGEKS